MGVTVKGVPAEAAPTPEDIPNYKQIWTYYLWGYTAIEIVELLKTSQVPIEGNVREYVLEAVRTMKECLTDESYQSLAENEFREYLAGSVQIEQELTDLFIQSKSDFYQLRSGNPRYEDGSKAMPMSVKELQSLLQAIDKVRQGRASVLARLSEPTPDNTAKLEDSPAKQLSEDDHEEFMSRLSRKPTPQLETETVDVKVREDD